MAFVAPYTKPSTSNFELVIQLQWNTLQVIHLGIETQREPRPNGNVAVGSLAILQIELRYFNDYCKDNCIIHRISFYIFLSEVVEERINTRGYKGKTNFSSCDRQEKSLS